MVTAGDKKVGPEIVMAVPVADLSAILTGLPTWRQDMKLAAVYLAPVYASTRVKKAAMRAANECVTIQLWGRTRHEQCKKEKVMQMQEMKAIRNAVSVANETFGAKDETGGHRRETKEDRR